MAHIQGYRGRIYLPDHGNAAVYGLREWFIDLEAEDLDNTAMDTPSNYKDIINGLSNATGEFTFFLDTKHITDSDWTDSYDDIQWAGVFDSALCPANEIYYTPCSTPALRAIFELDRAFACAGETLDDIDVDIVVHTMNVDVPNDGNVTVTCGFSINTINDGLNVYDSSA